METRERLKFILKETNPWWKKEGFKVEDYRDRDVFAQIQKFFKLPQIIALVGLRRTGKTTLMLKLIEKQVRSKSGRSILYFSFDDFSSLDIEEILIAYREIFPDINLKKGQYLFCFDEVQKLNNWQEKIKRLYDTYKGVKVVLSGSESLFLRKNLKETLGGRIFEFNMTPLSFKEYLNFTNNKKMTGDVELYSQEIVKLYKHFIKINGFPELTGIHDDMIIGKYLKESVIDKIVFKDIPQLFSIKNPEILAEMLDIIVFSPGQVIDMTKLSNDLNLTRQVVSSYLDYLEKAFLIKRVYNFSKSLRKQKRALKKYYPAVVYPSLVENNFPVCFENSLMWQLKAEFFYRDAYKNEVDIMMVGKKKQVVPIEIKTGRVNLAPVEYVMRKYKLSKALILTLNRKDKKANIRISPFYEHLLA